MTFVLHPSSHYKSITEPCARFLLSLLEHLSIDFPSHSILSIIDVYKDLVTRDKLIFPSTITRILSHFSVPLPVSNHFPVMGAIDATIVKRSEAQLRSRQSRSAAPSTPSAPSISDPSSFISDVTLENIMAQLVCMDACLDTLSDKLCQVNTHVSCIDGFVASPSPTLEASKDEDNDADADADASDDNDDDGDASSSNIDEMST